jgi:mannose-6-phosphate isomerase
MAAALVALQAHYHEKVWGTPDLSPLFPPHAKNIGEIWLLPPPGEPELPLLFKFLFTSGRLSVQVHPDDDFAGKHENSRGKTEMWHVLRADAGAELGIGFREELSPERLESSALSGEIEQLLDWRPAQAGDTVFIPAGTVHAIGAGLAICEIQQNSDVTYRLYDYGRPRELHLEKGALVSRTAPHDGRCAPCLQADGICQRLVTCDYFTTDLIDTSDCFTFEGGNEAVLLIAGEAFLGGQRVGAGQGWLIREPQKLTPMPQVRLLRVTWP